MFTVAIVGRPNVGKSTLFNRLTGTRHALVDDTPGVTRDVREGEGRLGPLEFSLLDTAGLEEAEKGVLAARMTEHSLRALKQADVALLLVDGRAGITPTDKHFAQVLRKSGRPAVVVVNKAEGRAGRDTLAEAHGLGFGEAIAISAEHGDGMSDLYDALAPFDKETAPEEEVYAPVEVAEGAETEATAPPLAIAIIGRPNAGKSTLMNRLLGEERVLTGPEAGITRDSIAVPFEYKGRAIKLVDTAGIRRRANVQEKLEKMSVGDALRAIQYAPVVILLMDATAALEKQDLQLASLVEREGRALILGINKWDLVPVKDRENYLKIAKERMDEALAQLKGVPVVPISAEKGKGMDEIMNAALHMYKVWNSRIPTGELNRWLEEALSRHAPPLIDGRRLKIRYMTQGKTRPPTFTLFCNLSEIPAHYLRYMTGSLREVFNLQGVPIRLKVSKNKNPYQDKKDGQ